METDKGASPKGTANFQSPPNGITTSTNLTYRCAPGGTNILIATMEPVEPASK